MAAAAARPRPGALGRLEITSAISAGYDSCAAAAIRASMLEPRPEMRIATRFLAMAGWYVGFLERANSLPGEAEGRVARCAVPSRRGHPASRRGNGTHPPIFMNDFGRLSAVPRIPDKRQVRRPSWQGPPAGLSGPVREGRKA